MCKCMHSSSYTIRMLARSLASQISSEKIQLMQMYCASYCATRIERASAEKPACTAIDSVW